MTRVLHFTVLVEGGSGPQPHPNFIGLFGDVAIHRSARALEGTREATEIICLCGDLPRSDSCHVPVICTST